MSWPNCGIGRPAQHVIELADPRNPVGTGEKVAHRPSPGVSVLGLRMVRRPVSGKAVSVMLKPSPSLCDQAAPIFGPVSSSGDHSQPQAGSALATRERSERSGQPIAGTRWPTHTRPNPAAGAADNARLWQKRMQKYRKA